VLHHLNHVEVHVRTESAVQPHFLQTVLIPTLAGGEVPRTPDSLVS
jgi:hypothetical protein